MLKLFKRRQRLAGAVVSVNQAKQRESDSKALPEGNPSSSGPHLEEITRGLLFAASAANQMVAQHYIQLLDQCFDVLADGSLRARTLSLQLAPNQSIEVPLVTLLAPRGMAMERMKVNMALRTDMLQSVTEEFYEEQSYDMSQFKVSVALGRNAEPEGNRDPQLMNVDLEFVAQHPPEGMMRVIEEYGRLILPGAQGEVGVPPDKPKA